MSVRLSTVFESRRGLLFLPIAACYLYVLGQSKPPETPDVNVKEVLLEEAKALIAAGAWIVDVRERVAYETRHIAGAISAPLSLLSTRIPTTLEVARANPVIVYCGDGSTFGPRGTQLLNQAGFAAAVNLKPGIQGWATAGLPMEHGAGKKA